MPELTKPGPQADILIIDDTPDNLRLLNQILARQYKVRLAPSGPIGLTAVRSVPPDLILLDIMMPGMSGYEVAEQLKADPVTHDIPIIFISALDDVDSKVQGFAVGGVDYVTKPFQEKEVLVRVNTHLSLRALYKQAQAELAERRQAEKTLRENQALFDLFIHNSPIYAYIKSVTSSENRVLAASENFDEMIGVPGSKMAGKTMEELFPAALAKKIMADDWDVVSHQHMIKLDEDLNGRNYTTIKFPIILGEKTMLAGYTIDITERKQAEEVLRDSRDKLSAANAALEKASRLKDEFLASMSHELRTPLTGILGLSEALQLFTYGPLNDKQLKALKTIETSGRHLLDLINDILDLSKIEAAKLDMRFEPFSVSDICQASLQLVKGVASQRQQNVSFNLDPAAGIIRADVRRLKQMLVNLLSNAVKFTPEGGSLGLDVVTSPEEKLIRFVVWDNGIGIKPDEMVKLFKPFVQLDSSLSRQYSGTGLGLSLVQRLAELHGGSVKVESTPGEGSRFTISLPWSPDVTRPAPNLFPNEPEMLLRNTLFIEDNELDAEYATRYLQELNIHNIIHPTIRGALEKAAFLRPSVILLDLHLPDGSGLDLLNALKTDARTHKIPVIIVSVEERRADAIRMGALGYLVKPFGKEELLTELNKAANLSRMVEPVMIIGSSGQAPLVMLADDNEMVLSTISDFLSAKGFRVLATRSGAELLECAPSASPDIILVDIQMPGMDGMETMRHLRAHPDPKLAKTPIIAVTALAMSGDREKCLEAGADDYISKPIAMKKLVDRILEILEQRNPSKP